MASHVFKLSDYRLFVHHIIKIFLVVIVLLLSNHLFVQTFSADNKMMALIIMKLPLDKYALIATALTTATLG